MSADPEFDEFVSFVRANTLKGMIESAYEIYAYVDREHEREDGGIDG